jgi:5-hydroxyisourate hydrolase-like protein (transthyretin family)
VVRLISNCLLGSSGSEATYNSRAMKLLLTSLLFLFASATQAIACSCAGDARPCEAYGDASAIFVGTVTLSTNITVKEGGHEFTKRKVHFHVDRALKNVEAGDIEVVTNWGEAACGYPFRLGGQYLVYAYSDGNKMLATGICNRTRPLSEAAPDLEYISGRSKAPPGGTIFGEVGFRRGDEYPWPPVKDARLLFAGPKQFEGKTDTDGKYSISGIPPGKYKVRVDLPAGLSIYNPAEELEVHDRGCRQVVFLAEPDTRITGKVLDAQGMSAADVLMELVPVTREVGHHPSYERTDKEGRYVMKLLKPGRYYLGVRIAGSAGATYVPYPQTYYPGVKDRSQATVITINEGQRIELEELILPARFIERTLNGIVVDADGTPVAGAAVWLKERQYNDSDMPYRRETDSEGRFSYPVYEGIKYELNAYVDSKERREKSSAPLEIVITSSPEPIKLVVKVN